MARTAGASAPRGAAMRDSRVRVISMAAPRH